MVGWSRPLYESLQKLECRPSGDTRARAVVKADKCASLTGGDWFPLLTSGEFKASAPLSFQHAVGSHRLEFRKLATYRKFQK